MFFRKNEKKNGIGIELEFKIYNYSDIHSFFIKKIFYPLISKIMFR